MSTLTSLPWTSADDFLRLDEESPLRHEYIAGRVYAMTGGTVRHDAIAGNVYAALHHACGDGPCRPFSGSVKVRVAEDRIYCPDVTVVCGLVEGAEIAVRNPCLVVEVLSDSTRRIDETEKLDAYIGLPSLRAYLIVEQAFRHVERHWRDEGGDWHVETITEHDPARSIPIPCPETTLTLDAIYRRVPGVEIGRTPTLRLREVPA